jgi:hypothetical protein
MDLGVRRSEKAACEEVERLRVFGSWSPEARNPPRIVRLDGVELEFGLTAR